MSMVGIKGIGWIAGGEYGCLAQDKRFTLDDDGTLDELNRKGLFTHPFRNFGRLDRISRMTAFAVALALRDAGIAYSPERKQDIGIVGTNSSGSLATDLLYFRDYIECGRTLGRGNLFIYTLPSSPLGEAAIHFGLQGPLFYAADGRTSLGMVFETAAEMLLLGEAEAMLAGIAEQDGALYAVLGRGRGAPICDINEARGIAEQGGPLAGMIRDFQAMKGKKVSS